MNFIIYNSILVFFFSIVTTDVKSQAGSDFFKYELNDFWIYSVSETKYDLEKFTIRDTTLTLSGLDVLIIKETLLEQKIDTILYSIKADSSLYSNQFYENLHLIYNSKIKGLENYWFGGETDIPELPYAIYTFHGFDTLNFFGKDRLIKFYSITISDDTTDNHVSFGVQNIGFSLIQDLGIYTIFSYEGGAERQLKGGTLMQEVFGDTTFKTFTSLDEAISLNKEIEVSDNYPNPFNLNTTFKISLSSNSNLKVDIFNTNGQKLLTVIDKVFLPGIHKIQLHDLQLNSGVYIVRFEANEFLISKKITLIK